MLVVNLMAQAWVEQHMVQILVVVASIQNGNFED